MFQSTIDKEELKKIFQKFYRISSGDRYEVRGYGLGLNYVKNVVQRHKGSITVTENKEQGSVFTMIIPIYNG